MVSPSWNEHGRSEWRHRFQFIDNTEQWRSEDGAHLCARLFKLIPTYGNNLVMADVPGNARGRNSGRFVANVADSRKFHQFHLWRVVTVGRLFTVLVAQLVIHS